MLRSCAVEHRLTAGVVMSRREERGWQRLRMGQHYALPRAHTHPQLGREKPLHDA